MQKFDIFFITISHRGRKQKVSKEFGIDIDIYMAPN